MPQLLFPIDLPTAAALKQLRQPITPALPPLPDPANLPPATIGRQQPANDPVPAPGSPLHTNTSTGLFALTHQLALSPNTSIHRCWPPVHPTARHQQSDSGMPDIADYRKKQRTSQREYSSD